MDPGSAVLTAAGGVLCGLLGVGIGIFRYNNLINISKLLLLILHSVFPVILQPFYFCVIFDLVCISIFDYFQLIEIHIC